MVVALTIVMVAAFGKNSIDTGRTLRFLSRVRCECDPASGHPARGIYSSVIIPFLNTYCTSCHGPTKSKGDVTLHDISPGLAIGKDMDLWNLVLKQLVLSEMPPSKEKQPSASNVSKVIDWINAELNKSGNATRLCRKTGLDAL